MFGGKHPLSKIGGQQLKDIHPTIQKDYLDMYRPPGIIKPVETAISAKSMIDDKIVFTVPSSKFYRRGRPDEPKTEKQERQQPGAVGGNNANLQGGDQKKENK